MALELSFDEKRGTYGSEFEVKFSGQATNQELLLIRSIGIELKNAAEKALSETQIEGREESLNLAKAKVDAAEVAAWYREHTGVLCPQEKPESVFRNATCIAGPAHGSFFIKKNSRISIQNLPSCPAAAASDRAALLAGGDIDKDGVLLTDILIYGSRSYLASIICGGSINGRTAFPNL